MPAIVRAGSKEIPSFEVVLVTRILETGDIRAAIKRRITEDFFFLPETRTAYSYLVGHYQQYGSTPSMELFRSEFPDFDLHTTSDSVDAVCDKLRETKLYRDLGEMIEEGVRLTRESPKDGLSHFRSLVASLTSQHVVTRDTDLTQTVNETLSEYERVKAGQGLLGTPWPWAKLNETTLGIQKEELIFFYARPKSLKTWLMIASAVHAFKHGRRVLFITMEMPTDQIRRRTHAVWGGVDYNAVRAGKLTDAEFRQYKEDLEAFSELKGFILSGSDENEGTGITAVSAKIQEYDPDLVFIDGCYLMKDDASRRGGQQGDWASMASITRSMKRLTKQANLPIIGSTQANRSGEKSKGTTLSEMAFSDSFAQDADYVIRVIYDKQQKDNNEAILTLPGIREASGCTFTINAFIAANMTQKWVADDQEAVDEVLAGTDGGIVR